LKIKGAARWIQVGSASFQPSELAKIAAVTTLAWWFAKDEKNAPSFLKGFVFPLLFFASIALPIAMEVDMGTTALLGATTFILMFVAGTRWRYLFPMILIGVCGLAFAVSKMPERASRVMAFLHPEKYPDDAYQQMQGLIALGSGGVEGLGLGNGRQKMAFLPEAHTDFILPVVGEELGLRVTLLIVFGFVVIIMCGAIISLRARDRFGMLLGFGIVVMIAFQAGVNIGVTTMVLPNKGFPLPFISYGGSNLVFCMLGVGVLINIYRQGLTEKEERVLTTMPVRVRKQQRRLPTRL
jgi:cell division protein FtsW